MDSVNVKVITSNDQCVPTRCIKDVDNSSIWCVWACADET